MDNDAGKFPNNRPVSNAEDGIDSQFNPYTGGPSEVLSGSGITI